MTIQVAKISAEQFHHIEVPGGLRFELVNGEVIVSPSPRSYHSHAVAGLIAILRTHIRAYDLGRLFTELDTEFSPLDVRRPDLMFATKKQLKKIDPNGAASSDDAELIVEVISLGSDRTDRVIKFQQYAKAGIRYYWIVDPQRRTFEAYVLTGKSYRSHVKASGDAVVRAKPFVDLAIPLQELWW
ncbi:MAG: Uma2 family endonuclease [Phycisphaerales bacterium]|nr:Uma2 family endonuclease [Phycisphaerales bacterium]